MTTGPFYRGGPRLTPRLDEVRVDRLTKLVRPIRGVSVYDRSDHPNLAKHGGAYLVGPLPDRLKIVQAGRDSSHHEIVPDSLMSYEDYEDLLAQVALIPA